MLVEMFGLLPRYSVGRLWTILRRNDDDMPWQVILDCERSSTLAVIWNEDSLEVIEVKAARRAIFFVCCEAAALATSLEEICSKVIKFLYVGALKPYVAMHSILEIARAPNASYRPW